MTGQSLRHSWFEALANVLVGLVIGFVANLLILPLLGVTINVRQSAYSCVAFTLVSLGRSFMLRRAFDWLHRRQASAFEATACMRRPYELCHLAATCSRGGCVFDKE